MRPALSLAESETVLERRVYQGNAAEARVAGTGNYNPLPMDERSRLSYQPPVPPQPSESFFMTGPGWTVPGPLSVPAPVPMMQPPARVTRRAVRQPMTHEEYYGPGNEFNRRRANYYDSGGLDRAVARQRAAEAAEKRKAENRKRTKMTVTEQRPRKRDRPDEDHHEQPEQQHVYNRQRTG